jgi:quinolinate synthase
MMGACHVHERIRPHHVEEQRRLHPRALTVVHPECGCTSACMRQVREGIVPETMLQFRSTQGMVKLIQEVPQKEVIVATEVGNLHPMHKAVPEKILIPASREALCAYMKQNTLENLYLSLRDLKHEITVDPELARRARLPIERMLEIG